MQTFILLLGEHLPMELFLILGLQLEFRGSSRYTCSVASLSKSSFWTPILFLLSLLLPSNASDVSRIHSYVLGSI